MAWRGKGDGSPCLPRHGSPVQFNKPGKVAGTLMRTMTLAVGLLFSGCMYLESDSDLPSMEPNVNPPPTRQGEVLPSTPSAPAGWVTGLSCVSGKIVGKAIANLSFGTPQRIGSIPGACASRPPGTFVASCYPGDVSYPCKVSIGDGWLWMESPNDAQPGQRVYMDI